MSWDAQINSLAKRISQECWKIKNLTKHCSLDVVRTYYFGCIYSILSYGLLCWGTSLEFDRLFKLQKRVIRNMVGSCQRTSCVPAFRKLKILPLPCMYIYQASVYIKQNLAVCEKRSDIHTYNTRHNGDLEIRSTRLTKTARNPNILMKKIFNNLPREIKDIASMATFKKELVNFLIDKCYYNVNEYLLQKF